MKVSSYTDVEILPDSILYCDIPYRSTEGYYRVNFDHDAFYEWALKQESPLFISEYSMPGEFECIARFNRTSSFCATNNGKKEIEKIFIPKAQKDMVESLMRKPIQPTLF